MTSEELALNIIHATGGDPARAKEAASVIDAWRTKAAEPCGVPPEHIAKIRALKGKKNQREIAAMFGISYQHVSLIQQGKLVRQRGRE